MQLERKHRKYELIQLVSFIISTCFIHCYNMFHSMSQLVSLIQIWCLIIDAKMSHMIESPRDLSSLISETFGQDGGPRPGSLVAQLCE